MNEFHPIQSKIEKFVNELTKDIRCFENLYRKNNTHIANFGFNKYKSFGNISSQYKKIDEKIYHIIATIFTFQIIASLKLCLVELRATACRATTFTL